LRSALTLAAGAAVGAVAGGATGAASATNEVANNYLKHNEILEKEELAKACAGGDDASCKAVKELNTRSDARDAQLFGCKGITSEACERLFTEARQDFLETGRNEPYDSTAIYQNERDRNYDMAYGWNGEARQSAISGFLESNYGVARPIGSAEGFFTFDPVGKFLKGSWEGINEINSLPETLAAGAISFLQDGFGYGSQKFLGPKTGIMGDIQPYIPKNSMIAKMVNEDPLTLVGDAVYNTVKNGTGASLLSDIYYGKWDSVGRTTPGMLTMFAGGAFTQSRILEDLTPSVAGEIQVGKNLSGISKSVDGRIGSVGNSIYESMRPIEDDFPELVGVNPHYIQNAQPGVNTNCVSCVNAAQQRLLGVSSDATASATKYSDQNGLLPSAPFGFGPETTPADVVSEMLQAGNGAARPLIILQPGNIKHVINVVNKDGVVYFIDSQMGKVVNLRGDVPVQLGRD